TLYSCIHVHFISVLFVYFFIGLLVFRFFFFFSSRRRHTRSVSAFLLNRSSDLIINGVERPVKAAELFAFTLRVRAGNTDVLTDAEENVRQKLRAEGVM